jgi:nicotinamide-nucleotide amidase
VNDEADAAAHALATTLVARLTQRGLTIAVAESLTGGLLVAALIRVPGASLTVVGGVVAYSTALKHSVLGVDATLLAQHGPVHPLVAEQMATGVRDRLAVDGRPADIGLATTGVAGPGPQDGHPAGTVYLGYALGERVGSIRLTLSGDRDTIRNASVYESLVQLEQLLGP